MHTSSHRFDHIGEDLAHLLRRQWAALVLRVNDYVQELRVRFVARAPGENAEIKWDDGEPEDKV
jgi:hypothetical protein